MTDFSGLVKGPIAIVDSAWMSYLQLENSMSLNTQISSLIKLLCLRQTQPRQHWNTQNSCQNLENSSPNSSLNSKNGRNLNSLWFRTWLSEAWWNSNSMKSEFIQALVLWTKHWENRANFWSNHLGGFLLPFLLVKEFQFPWCHYKTLLDFNIPS